MLRIRTMLGLGDCVYVYPIIKHFARTEKVIVSTLYPDVFKALEVETTREQTPADTCFRYQWRSPKDQYTQLCDAAGVRPPFVFDWPFSFSDDYQGFPGENEGRGFCVIKEPAAAHIHKGRRDFSMTPIVAEMQAWVKENAARFFFISVGHKEVFKSRLKGIDADMNDRLSVHDLLTLVKYSDMVATQIGHLVPIAQGLGKPLEVFEPENVTDARFKDITSEKVLVKGVYATA